jgi:hypothetical protein
MADLRTEVRQLTGAPFTYRAYVRDRATGKIVSSCTHSHGARGRKGAEKAQRCADRQLRAAKEGR